MQPEESESSIKVESAINEPSTSQSVAKSIDSSTGSAEQRPLSMENQTTTSQIATKEIEDLKSRIKALENEREEMGRRLDKAEKRCEIQEEESRFFEASLDQIEEKLR